MVKEKRILSYILGWLIVGFIIIFMGVNNVFAANYTGFEFTAQLYDNLGPTLNAVTTSGPAAGTGHYEGYIGYTAYSSGGAWGISSPITLIANHTYTLTVNVLNDCSYPILSSHNRIGVGTSLGGAVTSYQNNTNVIEVYSKAISNSFLVQYAFKPTINASYIVFPFATPISCSSTRTLLENITIEDLGIDGVTQDQINTSLNNQTNEINSSIQNSTDTITGEIDDMENAIIDSNKETQEVIKDQFNSCRPSYNLFDGLYEIGYININTGTNVNGTTQIRTKNFIPIIPNKEYTISGDRSGDRWAIFYDNNKNYISYLRITTETFKGTFISPQNAYYVKWYIPNYTNINNKTQLQEGSIATEWEPYGEEICSNKIDDTNDKLDGIQGALTDTSNPDLEILGDSAGWLPPGPLDSVLNLPLTMLNNLLENLGKTCSTLRVELPFVNKNIEIPCIESLMEEMGALILWRWVGRIASVIILYGYLMNLYAWADKILTLRAEFDEAMGVDLANWGRL